MFIKSSTRPKKLNSSQGSFETLIKRIFNFHGYDIFYHFDNKTDCIVYEAIINSNGEKEAENYSFSYYEYYYADEKEYTYIKLECPPQGISNPDELSNFQKIFLNFLIDNESSISNDDEYINYYKNIESYIKPLMQIDPKTIAARTEIRAKLNYLISNVSNELLSENQYKGKIHILIYANLLDIKSDEDTSVSIDLKLINKTTGIKSSLIKPSTLLENIRKGKPTNYGKNFLAINTLSSFDDESKECLKALPSFMIEQNNYGGGRIYFDIDDVFNILAPFNDNYVCIYSNNESKTAAKTFSLKTFTNPIINIDDEGNINADPNPKYYDQTVFFKNTGLMLDTKKQEAILIRFNDPTYYYVYKFLSDINQNDLVYVNDIFKDKFVPLIENKSQISEKYKEKNRINSIKINLYADIDSKDVLHLSTKYLLGQKEISQEEIDENEIYKNKQLSYYLALKDYNLVENGSIKDGDIVLNFLTGDLSNLRKTCEIYLSDSLSKLQVKKPSKFTINTKFNGNLIDYSVKNKDLTIEEITEILSKYRQGKKFVRLKDNIIQLNDANVKALAEFDKEFEISEEQNKSIPLYEIFNLSTFKDELDLNFDKKISSIISEIMNYKKIEYMPEPIFNNILRQYQLEAFNWLMILRKYGLSGILADDMGLGKTLETICFISSLIDEKPILIVCPKSLVYNWEAEIKKWNPNLPCSLIIGLRDYRKGMISRIDKKKKVVYVTSYDSLRTDIGFYEGIEFSLAILDEAQYIKNFRAQKTIATKQVKSKTRLILTGTPIENSLLDLWSMFDFLMPGYLGNNNSFRSDYENLIMDENKEASARLNGKISPFILRRVKKDVLKDLPEKIESEYICSMSSAQKEIYDAYLEKARLSAQTDPNDRIGILGIITKLRQTCIDPSMFLENYEDISDKLETCLQLVKDAIDNGHKVLVFSSFTTCLEHFISLLEEENIPSYYIWGGVEAKKRIELCESFNKYDDVKVFCISLKAGGTGLNLTGADIVIHLDPWWNVAVENQASDRAHRIGQEHTVNVIRLITKDSIEEKVINLQKMKKDLFDKFIGEGDKGVSSFSEEDIKYLLS